MNEEVTRAAAGMLRVGAVSEQGPGRNRNEDRARILKRGIVGGVVTDGMGGHAGGSVYSETCCWKIARLLEEGSSPAAALEVAATQANGVANVLGLRRGGATAACCMVETAAGSKSPGGTQLVARTACIGDARVVVVGPDGSVREQGCSSRIGSAGVGHLGPGSHGDIISASTFQLVPGGALVLLTDGAAFAPTPALVRAVEVVRGGGSDGGRDDGRCGSGRAEAVARAIVQSSRAHGSQDDATALVVLYL